MIGDLWTFGDSFASTDVISKNDWFSNIIENFKGSNYFNSFCSARDTQTIMDLFYRNLCNIKDNSLVVIWLPTLARIRYPKNPNHFSKLLESDYVRKNVNEFNVNEYFIHFPYYQYPLGTPKKEIDFPFNHFDLNEIDGGYVTYDYNDKDVKNQLNRIVKEDVNSIKPIDFSKLSKISQSSVENWNDIFFSLKNFCNFEILFVSWTDDYNNENVIGKTQLTKEIGIWHTQHDDFLESNGSSGIEWDEHFSKKMNIEFSNWVMNKYPQYFNI